MSIYILNCRFLIKLQPDIVIINFSVKVDQTKAAFRRQTNVGKLKLVSMNDTTTCWQTVGENRDKFYLSPTVRQHVVLSFTHTNFEFADTSWPTLV